MSVYLYNFWLLASCLPICLPTCIVSAQLYCMMSAYLYDVFLPVWCLPTCICLLSCVMSARLCAACTAVWYALLDDARQPVLFCLPLWCLLYCMMTVYLYDVCSPLGCLPTFISAYSYDVDLCLAENVDSTVCCLPTCNNCLPVAQASDWLDVPGLYSIW